jgi:hypothetical protein
MRGNVTVLVLIGVVVEIAGCAGPHNTIADGDYFLTLTEEGGSTSPMLKAHVKRLPKGKVNIAFRVEAPNGESGEFEFNGRISGNTFHSDESFDKRSTAKWEGVLTANDRIEGHVTSVEVVGGRVQKYKWTLAKAQSESP